MKQVFNNLLLNAVEADKESKGNIIVEAGNVDTIEENIPLKNGQYVKVTVKDKGIGILWLGNKQVLLNIDKIGTIKLLGIHETLPAMIEGMLLNHGCWICARTGKEISGLQSVEREL